MLWHGNAHPTSSWATPITAPWHSTEPTSPSPPVMRTARANKDWLCNGRAQRRQLAPLRKTATSWLPSSALDTPLYLLRPLQASPRQTGTDHNSKLKGGISTEFLREKGELEFEAFLDSYHGLMLRPEDFKWAKRGQSPGSEGSRLGSM